VSLQEESLTVQVRLAPTAGASFGHPAATVLVDDQTTFNTATKVGSENTTNVSGNSSNCLTSVIVVASPNVLRPPNKKLDPATPC
jgi:hypothetical protein